MRRQNYKQVELRNDQRELLQELVDLLGNQGKKFVPIPQKNYTDSSDLINELSGIYRVSHKHGSPPVNPVVFIKKLMMVSYLM